MAVGHGLVTSFPERFWMASPFLSNMFQRCIISVQGSQGGEDKDFDSYGRVALNREKERQSESFRDRFCQSA